MLTDSFGTLQTYLEVEGLHQVQVVEYLKNLDERLQRIEAGSHKQFAETHNFESCISRLELLEARLALLEVIPSPADACTGLSHEASRAGDLIQQHKVIDRPDVGHDHQANNEIDSTDYLCYFTHPIARSSWEAPLIVGLRSVRFSDSGLLLLGTVVNIVLQSLFIFLAYEEFLPMPDELDENAVDNARYFRISVAHSALTMDPASFSSLAARVCKRDRTLITSMRQVDLLSSIDSYLNLVPIFPDTWSVRTGPMLFCLVLAMWSMLIFGELKQIPDFAMAVMTLPRGSGTQVLNLPDGSLQVSELSLWRACAVMMVSALRLTVVLMLFYIGACWLAHTTSITDLVLNASALSFIIGLDELVHLSLSSTSSVRALLDRMKPLQIHANRYSAFMRALPFVLMGCTGLSMCFMMTTEISLMLDRMHGVQYELCERGNLDFVLDMSDLGIVVASSTQQVPDDVDASPNTFLKQATSDFMELKALQHADHYRRLESLHGRVPDVPHSKPWIGVLVWSQAFFRRYINLQTKDIDFPACIDVLTLHEEKGGVNMTIQAVTSIAQYNSGVTGTTCADFLRGGVCSSESATDLRLVCSRTCGCASAEATLFQSKDGCLPACLLERKASLEFFTCKDRQASRLIQDSKVWIFMDYMFTHYHCNNIEMFRDAFYKLGCTLFAHKHRPLVRSVCGETFMQIQDLACGRGFHLAPDDAKTPGPSSLRTWCPVTCGCLEVFSNDCPHGCSKCSGDPSKCPEAELDTPTCAGGLCRSSQLHPDKLHKEIAPSFVNRSLTCVQLQLEFLFRTDQECAAFRSSADINETMETCCEAAQF